MSQSRLLAKNTASQILAKAITASIGLVTRKLLTNYLGPAGFGDYVFALTYATLFGSIADWGTLLISVREAARNPAQESRIFGSALIGRLILSLTAAIIALAVLPFLRLSPAYYSTVAFATILIVFFALKASLGIIFEAKLRMDKWLVVEVITSALTLLLFTITIYLNLPLVWFLVSLLLATIVSVTVATFLSRGISSISLDLDWSLMRRLAVESLPMGGVLIMFSVYNRIDTLILKFFRPSSEVGIYGLSYFLYENVLLVAAYLMNSALPLLSRQVLSGEPTSAFKVYYQKILDLMLILALGAVITTFLVSPLLVRLVSSSSFAGSIPLLRILSFSLFFSFLNHVTGFSLVALGRQRTYLWITLAALTFNILLNLLFVPSFGATASAWITVGTEALVQALTLFLIAKSLNHFPSFSSFPRTALQFIRTRGKIF